MMRITQQAHIYQCFGMWQYSNSDVNYSKCNKPNLDTTLCNGGSIVVNGTTYDGSNPTGQETFTLAGGCDSIVTITVTELAAITNSINPTICSNGSYVAME